MLKKIGLYVLGLFILALGVSISVKSNLGVSPVSSLAYVLSLIFPVKMGYFTMGVFISFILVQFLLLGKEFKITSSLQVLCSVVFGYFVNFSNALLSSIEVPENLPVRLFLAVLSAAVCGLGIFLYVGARVMPLPAEGLTEVISVKVEKPFSKVKVIFDLVMLLVSVLFSLFFLDSIRGIGVGTLISALLIGKFVGIFSVFLKEPLALFLRNKEQMITAVPQDKVDGNS